MNTTKTDNAIADHPFMTFVKNEITKKAFRGFVGMQLQCPCGSILDCRSAVGIDISDRKGKLQYSKIFCPKCGEKALGNLPEVLDMFRGATAEITKGEELYK